MSKLRVGVIGLGVGEQHIAGYRQHPGCEIAAVCDFSARKRELARLSYATPRIYERATDLLEDPQINVVSVASYDNDHFEHVEQAIVQGKHVFVEKPLCLHPQQARRLRGRLLEHPSVRLSSNLILRRCPRFMKLERLISKGHLGSLYYVEGDYEYGRMHKLTDGWRGDLAHYSVVCGGAVHVIDLLLWLSKDEVVEVFAYGTNIASHGSKFEHHDTVVSVLKFESGMIGKVTANFPSRGPHFHGLKICGTKAAFVNGTDRATLHHAADGGHGGQTIDAPYPGVHKGDLVRGFIDSILSGKEAPVTAEDTLRSMAVCFAIEQSCREGQPVEVEYP